MRAGVAIAVAAALALVPGATAGSASAARPCADSGCSADRSRIEILSNPGHLSRWAFVLHAGIARAHPRSDAKAVARLRLRTQDGTSELVMLLSRFVDLTGRRWVRVRLPILPNNSTGWVPQADLGGFHKVRTWLQIDTRHLQARLVRSARTVFTAPIGVGRPQWPTPKGQFYVRDRLEGFPKTSIYGALAFGLNARSAVLTEWPAGGFVGVHGTNEPYLIPGRISHGCIRMRNHDIVRLARLMPVGTPVTIR